MGWFGELAKLAHMGRQDTSPIVRTVERPAPHPYLIDVTNDSLVLRFPARRANYIESWNGHVLSPQRDAMYMAWRRAEDALRTEKNARKFEQKRIFADHLQVDLEQFDVAWAISQPINWYRVAFYAYDHFKGQPEQRDGLFRVFANTSPREKQQARLAEVERAYAELTRPLGYEEERQIQGKDSQRRMARIEATLAEQRAVARQQPPEVEEPAAVVVDELPAPPVREPGRPVFTETTTATSARVGETEPDAEDEIPTPDEVAAFLAQRRAARGEPGRQLAGPPRPTTEQSEPRELSPTGKLLTTYAILGSNFRNIAQQREERGAARGARPPDEGEGHRARQMPTPADDLHWPFDEDRKRQRGGEGSVNRDSERLPQREGPRRKIWMETGRGERVLLADVHIFEIEMSRIPELSGLIHGALWRRIAEIERIDLDKVPEKQRMRVRTGRFQRWDVFRVNNKTSIITNPNAEDFVFRIGNNVDLFAARR